MLANAKWIATNSDGTITTNYNEINRDTLDTFELKYKKQRFLISKKLIFKLPTKGKTLIHRLKTQAKGKYTSEIYIQNKQAKELHPSQLMPLTKHRRIRIIALLQRNKNPKKNKTYNNYSFDPNLSEIHYIFEDGTIQKRNDFGDRSPYLPLELFPEELKHLIKGA